MDRPTFLLSVTELSLAKTSEPSNVLIFNHCPVSFLSIFNRSLPSLEGPMVSLLSVNQFLNMISLKNYSLDISEYSRCQQLGQSIWEKYFLSIQSLFWQCIPCDNRTQSPALFQNSFRFCTIQSKFSIILPFFCPSFTLFQKNCMHMLIFWNRPCHI